MVDIKTQVHEALRILSGQCNGASNRDQVGFNRYDAGYGKELALVNDLSPEQVLRGAKMLQKYHGQLLQLPSVKEAQRYFAIHGPREETQSEDEKMETYIEGTPVPATTNKQSDIVLSGEQKSLLEIMEGTRQHLFITGRAGTGKSVLLRHFREITKKRVVVAAPTGIAALNVKGQTIHSLFKLAPGLLRPGSLAPNSRLHSLLKRIDTLVIDEISMVRADLLDSIDERFREACKSDEPFGGKQVIMYGDVFQLPPVVEPDLMPYFERVFGGYFFFNASVWQHAKFKIYELSQVFRQRDPIFKDVLNAVRDGSVIDSQIDQLNSRYGVPIPANGTVTLAPTNALVTNINQQRLNRLEGRAHEYKATITGEMKRGTFPTEEILQLKVGAQVVLLQNDKDKRWVNGTVATISSLKKDAKEEHITVRVDGIDYHLEKTTWEEIKYEYDPTEGKVKEEVVSSFTQYPIRLAWAMTIHKSQGQTYESVALDLTTATFAPGQLYVALSRCTSLEGLYLKLPVKRGHIIVEPKVAVFMAQRETIQAEVQPPSQSLLSQEPETPIVEEPATHVETRQEMPALPVKHLAHDGQFVPKGKAEEMVKVGYKFPKRVAEKLDRLAELANKATGKRFDKSAFIAQEIDGKIDDLIALLEKQQ